MNRRWQDALVLVGVVLAVLVVAWVCLRLVGCVQVTTTSGEARDVTTEGAGASGEGGPKLGTVNAKATAGDRSEEP